MELYVEKRYLKIPVKFAGENRRFTLSENGAPVYAFDAAYAPDAPDAEYYADLRDYAGRTVALDAPENFVPVFCDAPAPLTPAQNALRPAVHFTAERGWINDPNGLCFYDGRYHLFYQHNPYGRLWGNMHWGHAVSPDLFHWTHREEALFSDMEGAMFSGSAVVDRENCAGLKRGSETPLLFFYTSAGKRSTQCLAYSTDGGETLVKYGGNPLLPELAGGNRDPKVVFDAERSRWLMALYFEGRNYGIFVSQDLLHWTLLQRFDLPGDDECPDLYPLTADDGRTLWIYSGAHDMYYVGEFDKKGLYQPIQAVGQLSYSSAAYAAQTYFYEPGKPVIRLAWNRSEIPGAPFNGSMCTPMEMTLRNIGGRYYLCAYPVEGVESLVRNETRRDGETLCDYAQPLRSKACRIAFETKSAPFSCKVYGLDIRVETGGVSCGEAFLPRTEEETMQVEILCDTTSTEIYLNGTAITAVPHVQDPERASFSLHAETPVHFEKFRVAELAL